MNREALLVPGLVTLALAAAPGAAASYGWPVKPFDREHPVRGAFGDPRTVFDGPPGARTLLYGGGKFQFHFGVDVSAPNGTAVYPVESGVVTEITAEKVRVDGAGGRAFEYWHIAAAVRLGQRVQAYRTVLGRIVRPAGHVHLTEIDGGVIVNPLQRGHLTPYADTTSPAVTGVRFGGLAPDRLHGRVEIVAAAHDLPSLPVPGAWNDLPVTPALVEWRVVSAGGRVVVPTRVVYDVRRTLPAPASFWLVYARGTYQNMCVFGKHYSYGEPGQYLFRLAPGGFDTRALPDGAYELVVTAVDIRGNSGSLRVPFAVVNATAAH